MKISIIDFGMGNLGSVRRALIKLGFDPEIADRPQQLRRSDRIILPGVGAFADGMEGLSRGAWVDEIRHQIIDRGKPILGICLGMQLLATNGTEGGMIKGLDLIPGEVRRLDSLGCQLRIPHVGWNSVSKERDFTLFSGIPSGTDFYFAHSYCFIPSDSAHALAKVVYGPSVVASVGSANIMGTQFHPEKSSRGGLRLLLNYIAVGSC